MRIFAQFPRTSQASVTSITKCGDVVNNLFLSRELLTGTRCGPVLTVRPVFFQL
jgi:hypothetical protein